MLTDVPKHSPEQLHEHISVQHKRSPFQEYLKEIVYGGNDGIVTTFAVVAGFAGAGGGDNITAIGTGAVLLFGLANLFADAASMGLGNYLSVRSEQDAYRTEQQKELQHMDDDPQREYAESIHLLEKKGFNEDDAKAITKLYAKNKSYWLEFMMNNELELKDPTRDNPLFSGIATFLAFIAFGSIPLWPYIVLSGQDVFPVSIGATFVALLLLGILRWKVTQQSPIRSISEVLLIGGISASIAFFVGTFFNI